MYNNTQEINKSVWNSLNKAMGKEIYKHAPLNAKAGNWTHTGEHENQVCWPKS